MLSSALIAMASLLSLQTARDFVNQFCTGINGTGTCTTLTLDDSCTNTTGVQSLVLQADAACQVFPQAGCAFTFGSTPVLQEFSDISRDLTSLGVISSIKCLEDVGTVNGFQAGSPQDIAQEAKDTAEGIPIVGP
ncbi:hypothetical protein K438DRAFT_1762931 [Mycena galopus ATCC 62051]|nr:hypothetical protein K438DRAFT_1762931 [Mycena galopus ATCC 62051]